VLRQRDGPCICRYCKLNQQVDSTQSESLLKFGDVSKTYVDEHYREVHALNEISFSLRSGEFISLIGPSGCGKSTILRLAAGLELPTNGEVLYAGVRVAGPGPERGLVFQAYNAFPWLTVRENVGFGVRHANDGRVQQIDKWLGFMGLSDFADVYPRKLSGGMLQRLALARTMIVQPQLLLLDEPFGALDERTRDGMQQLLLRVVSETHCTVLLVTHDIREAILLSDRVIMLQARPGQIREEFSMKLPKPRSRGQLKSQAFNSIYECIIEKFPS
jgi:NitT/TauT family transport system ATP-binding protein